MQETGGNDAAPVTVGYPYLENWNESYERNPIGLLIEITNSQKWRTLFTQCMQVVKDGKTLFCTSVVVNGRKFPDCYSPQKKQAKKDACLLAMRLSYLKTRSLIDSLNPAQQIDLARTMNLTPDDVTMAESLNQMYQENGTEDAYGVSSLPGTRPPEGGAFIHGGGDYPQGGYDYGQNTDFYSFEGQSFDNNGDGIKSGNGEGPDFPIPQYGIRPPQVYTGQKRRLAPGETVVAQKKVKKNPGPKSPVSAVLEYGQKTSQEVKFEVVSEGGQPHRPMIVMNVVLGDKTFPSVEARGKKAGRTAAALACLRQLAEEGTFVDPAVDLWPVEPEVKVETEIKPATEEPGPPEVISGSLPPVKAGEKVKGLTTESFALIHKHPITALMEYGQQRRVPAKIETVEERGPSHDSVFVLAAVIGDRTFPSVECKKKKFGRLLAADKALRILVSEGEYISQLTTGPAELATITEDMTHFDKMAALSHQTFNSLIAELNQSVPGRKVLAAIIVKQSDDDLGTVVSIGSGNRCVSGDQLSMEGTTVNDSHAEVVARRSFLRYLYKKLQGYDPKADDQLFEGGPQGKLRVKEGVTFHMYISTAPCGDGALFSPRDTSFKIQPPDADIESREHKPLFTSEVQGLLRTKVEGGKGEGTIPVETDLIPQTWDGLQRGERLRTMSCTDKICRWNVTGIQGALLSHFIEPIYLESVTIGFLYDHGHLARALCCRLTQGDTPIQGLLPTGYRLNHPWLGRVTICKPPRDTYKTRSQSLNWCLGDTVSEVTDGTLGMIKQKPEDEAPKFSRLCKRQMFEQFKALCFKFRKEKLLDTENYAKCKLQAEDYQVAKQQLCTVLQKNKYGTWVSKPIEEELFSL